MWMYPPPPTNVLFPPDHPGAKMIPDGGPFQPFPGGPWFRVVTGPGGAWQMQIYYNGAWQTTPNAPPNTAVPGQTPPLDDVERPSGTIGRPTDADIAGKGIIITAAASALYDSFKNLWDAIQAVRAEDAAYDRAVASGMATSAILSRAQTWLVWLANDPGGIKLAATLNCIQNNIAKIQNEIDRLTTKTSPTMADYAQLAMLKQSLANMQRDVKAFSDLRSNYILYGGQLPSTDQVNAFSCETIPLEVAPFPVNVTPQGPMATVPDTPPVGSGPLFPGPAYPSTGPLFPQQLPNPDGTLIVTDDGTST